MSNPFAGENATQATSAPMPQDPSAQFGTPEDPGFSIDLTGVQSDFTIPDGTYEAICTGIEKKTSQKGNPMWVWNYTIVKGEYQGRDWKLFTALTPNALWKLKETFKAYDMNCEGKVSFTPDQVIGKLVFMDMVKGKDNNGNERTNIKKIHRHTKGPVRFNSNSPV